MDSHGPFELGLNVIGPPRFLADLSVPAVRGPPRGDRFDRTCSLLGRSVGGFTVCRGLTIRELCNEAAIGFTLSHYG